MPNTNSETGPIHGGLTSEPPAVGNVIFLSAEDDAADTIKPRLIAAGADTSLCHILDAVKTTTHGGEWTHRQMKKTGAEL